MKETNKTNKTNKTNQTSQGKETPQGDKRDDKDQPMRVRTVDQLSGVLPMSLMLRASSKALVLAATVASLALAGCAADGSNIFTTGALGSSDSKVDPECVTLASRIETLRREGIPEKLEKAAAKKYTMTHADLVKADQLTKTNAEFQQRCSTAMPMNAQLPAQSSVAGAPTKPAKPPAQ
jgi:hypothetical protein